MANLPFYEKNSRSVNLYGGLSNQGQPDPLHPEWVAGNVEWMLEQMHNLQTTRILFRQPAGSTPGPLAFSNWHVLNDAQRACMTEAVRTWKGSHHLRRVGIYTHWAANNPYNRLRAGMTPATNLDNDVWRWVCQEIQAWADIGFDEWWLDNASTNNRVDSTIAILTHRVREKWGLHIGIEAFPGDPHDWSNLKWEYLRHTAALALWPFVWHRMVKRANTRWVVPEGYELHVLMRPGYEMNPRFDYPTPTTGDKEMLEDLGFIISWNGPPFELPEGPPSPPDWEPPPPPPEPNPPTPSKPRPRKRA